MEYVFNLSILALYTYNKSDNKCVFQSFKTEWTNDNQISTNW